MKLTDFRVQYYRNILDSSLINVQPDVTCLVGKNESGKTALLYALFCLKPSFRAKFDESRDYPRWLLAKHRRANQVAETKPISATFELDPADVAAVEKLVGPGVLVSEQFTYEIAYDGSRTASVTLNEEHAVANLLDSLHVDSRTRETLLVKEFNDLPDAIDARREELSQSAEDEDIAALRGELDQVSAGYKAILDKSSSLWQAVVNVLKDRMPTFFYVDNYARLPGRIDLKELAGDDELPASSAMQTARALVKLAGTNVQQLSDEEYEERKAELEAVSNDLTAQVFEYWRQNEELEVQVDIDKQTVTLPNGHSAVARYLDIRVRDKRHGYTSNFGVRSSGFQWFFSFLAAFSEFEDAEDGVVVLLDEPGLTLHGKAQADFLRFINERLAPHAQVIYTTHSPFMVEMGRLERIRVVEDKGAQTGATVSEEVLTVGSDTVFPLQAALGYDISQSLFVGEANLLVEGTSDFTYLTVMSDHLASIGRSSLDERWRILPAGGAANVPAFVALMGGKLEVTVLTDSGTKGMQRLHDLSTQGLLNASRLLTVGQIIGRKNADIEDLFSPGDYVFLYNGAFGTGHKVNQLPPGDRIIDQIGRLEGTPFVTHGKPADYLLRNRDQFFGRVSSGTLSNFESLVDRINKTLNK